MLRFTIPVLCAVTAVLIGGCQTAPVFPGNEELHSAIAEGDYAKVEAMLDAEPSLVEDKLPGESTPLFIAVHTDRDEIVQLLIDRGADVHARDNIDWTPLHWAVLGKHYEAARLLVAAGADPDAKSAKTVFTPRNMAEEYREDPRMLEILEMQASQSRAEEGYEDQD